MQTHRRDAAALLGSSAMDWAKAAESFANAGLLDEHGRRPTAETAEAAWRRVTKVAPSVRKP
jgi:hypothetical protein